MRKIIFSLILTFAWGPALCAINPAELGIVVNLDDPDSEAIARYYRSKRNVPAENVVRVRLTNNVAVSGKPFEEQKALVDALPARVRALALTFTRPVKVDAYNAITSAISYGYYLRPASEKSIAFGYTNPYPARPMRISMMIPGPLEQAKALIDRGVASDRTYPDAPFLCMLTSDRIRNQRCYNAPPPLTVARGNAAPGPAMGYFQGLAVIPAFPTFLPGAWADNLTSAGAIEGGSQTTVWEILAAGATGSHGTVEEPYAVPGKFPNPVVFSTAYMNGDTLIEAAWKSVRYPYQGLFVGEPLANPWMRGQP